MRTMKPKAKLKKKDARYGKMKLANGQNADETSDFSQLRKPVDTNLSSLKQVAELFEKGSDEIKTILKYECDIVYECRICRSLFRSLANFISHKRVYCIEKYCFVPRRRDIDSTDSTFELELSIDPDLRKNSTNDRILRSQSQLMHVESRKDLTSVVDMLTKKQNNVTDVDLTSQENGNSLPFHITSDDEKIVLEIMDSGRAAYQTVSSLENIATGELMKNQTLELKNIINQTTGVLGPDGQLVKISNDPQNEDLTDDEEALPLDDRLVASGDIVCTKCNAKFATKKTLTFHMKSKHLPHRMCYPCLYCTNTFTNRWSVYRHLFKVHRKTNDQVRKIRSQIQARPYKREVPKLEKIKETNEVQKGDDKINEEQSSNNDEDNLDSEVETHNCKRCGKRFEHSAMLISHSQNCPEQALGAGRRRARKIPPQRHSGLVETEIISFEGWRKEKVQMDVSGIPQVSSSSAKSAADSNDRKSESSPGKKESELIPVGEKLELSSIRDKSESSTTSRNSVSPPNRISDFSSAKRKSKLISMNEILESVSVERNSEAVSLNRKPKLTSIAQKSESSSTNRKSKSPLIIRRKPKLSSVHKVSGFIVADSESSESSSLLGKSESMVEKWKSESAPITQKSKVSPINRKLKTPAIIRRKIKLPSPDKVSAILAADCASETELASKNSKWDVIDRKSELFPTHRKSKVTLTDSESDSVSIDRKFETVSRSRKPNSNCTDKKLESICNNRKSESSAVSSDGVAIERAKLPSIVTNPAAEISIRVEEVSSLSKDVWDKMGTSDEATDSDLALETTGSSMVRSPLKKLAESPIKKFEKSCKSRLDIPEVIYTTIDNSRPVELSVLNKEKKLGIQYRGIRLPTVTLEKINVPRAQAKERGIELSSNVPKEKPEFEAISQSQQYRSFQCLPCNRRFTSAANLRKHISAHVRRDRYRCKLCEGFKSLLKCDVVAHCNTVHNTKNDRNLLAELVVEEPIHGDTSADDTNHAVKPPDEFEIIDVGSSSKEQGTTVLPIENEIAVDESTEKSEIEESTDAPTNVAQLLRPDPRPKRGRPPNVKNKTKRGRKKRVLGRKRVLRHVSPPRLPEEPSDEIPPVIETMEDSAENISQISSGRAPSRMDCDPELRKMVMEVIFGSGEFDQNSEKIDNDSQEFENDSHSINDDFDQVIGCRENLVPSPPIQQLISTDPDLVAASIQGDDTFNNQHQIPNNSNNNLLHQVSHNYELKTIADNHDPIVFSKQSNFVAIQVSTENPLACQQHSLSPGSKHSSPNDHLVEAEQTEITVCTEK
ncbi:uncharacterized protein [Venturia canescens]|uniref:uncharacterized protein n=1 Tax=Venturia canescens TaxID=32260 RepID=UPI001C9C31A4|nr:uncharacterized protein LOC122408667 [Venturia canescens]